MCRREIPQSFLEHPALISDPTGSCPTPDEGKFTGFFVHFRFLSFISDVCAESRTPSFSTVIFFREIAMDYVRHGEIQGRYMALFKAYRPVFYHVRHSP